MPLSMVIRAQTEGISTSFLARSSKIDPSELGYAQPTFPFNILPGRAEIICRNFIGYALERCKTDVKARTQLFIALAAVFGFVILCVGLMIILTCIRRTKARSRLARTPLSGTASQQIGAVFTSAWKKKDSYDLEDKLPRRGTVAGRPRSGEDAVDTEEQGIADRDALVTLDGMTCGWMQLIRQRTNMQLPCNPLPERAPDNLLPSSIAPVPRIPSLKLPTPTLTTFRKTGSLSLALEKPSKYSTKRVGNGKGKGKDTVRSRWDVPV